MDTFSGILFKMDTGDANCSAFTIFHVDNDLARANDGITELCYLIALRQIGIEIVLPIKHREPIDLRFDPEASPHRLFNRHFIDYRQHARHSGINQRNMFIRFCAERRTRA